MVEISGRLGVKGSNFIDERAAIVVGGEGWRIDGQEGSGEGTPSPNCLGDHTGRHFKELGVALQAPA